MPTNVTPIPPIDRGSPTFRSDVDDLFGQRIPTFTVQINAVGDELMTARDEAVAARNETVPLANQVITLAPQAIQASNNVNILAPQVQANANQVAADKAAVTTMVAGATQIQMGGSTGYPTIGPSLIFNPAHARMLKRRMVFTRASSATYLDQMGRLRSVASGMPVFEFNAAGRSLGYRIEPARTNSLLYSDQFGNAAWVKSAGTTADIQPSGVFRLTKSASAFSSVSQINRPVTAGQPATAWFDVEPGTNAEATLLLSPDGTTILARVAFNLNAGTWIDASSTALLSAGMRALPGGGWKIWVTITAAPGSTLNAYLYPDRYNSSNAGYIGVWRGQLEAGPSPTSYIPTTSAAATRPADILTLPAAAAADVLNPREGAFVVEIDYSAVGTILEFNDGSSTNRLVLFCTANSINWQALDSTGGIGTASIQNAVAGAGRIRISAGWDANGMRISVNGSPVVSAPPTRPIPTVMNRLDIAHTRGGAIPVGHIAQLYAYPRMLTEAELIALSRL